MFSNNNILSPTASKSNAKRGDVAGNWEEVKTVVSTSNTNPVRTSPSVAGETSIVEGRRARMNSEIFNQESKQHGYSHQVQHWTHIFPIKTRGTIRPVWINSVNMPYGPVEVGGKIWPMRGPSRLIVVWIHLVHQRNSSQEWQKRLSNEGHPPHVWTLPNPWTTVHTYQMSPFRGANKYLQLSRNRQSWPN